MQITNENSSVPDFNMEELKKRLIIENDFLTKLVDTIPASMYFENEIKERIAAEKHLSMDKAAEGCIIVSFSIILLQFSVLFQLEIKLGSDLICYLIQI